MRKLLLMLALASFGAAASAPAEAFMDRTIGHEIIKPFVPAPGAPPNGKPSRHTNIPSCAAFGSGCGSRKLICDAWGAPRVGGPHFVPQGCIRWHFIQ